MLRFCSSRVSLPANPGCVQLGLSCGVLVAKDDGIEMEGVIKEVYQGGNFLVETADGLQIKGHLAGRLRRYRIRVVLGDRVTVVVSPYDVTRGRITFRHK